MKQNTNGTPARYNIPVFPTGILKAMTTNRNGHRMLKGPVIFIIVFFFTIYLIQNGALTISLTRGVTKLTMKSQR